MEDIINEMYNNLNMKSTGIKNLKNKNKIKLI